MHNASVLIQMLNAGLFERHWSIPDLTPLMYLLGGGVSAACIRTRSVWGVWRLDRMNASKLTFDPMEGAGEARCGCMLVVVPMSSYWSNLVACRNAADRLSADVES